MLVLADFCSVNVRVFGSFVQVCSVYLAFRAIMSIIYSMKKILAVSGGVDSVVMLDFCCHVYPREDLVVAHFNHGIRDNADDDELFVKNLAHEYQVEFVSQHGELGKNASENLAREKRYEFLRAVASNFAGEIYTAHHLDDLVETVLINLVRGTGWRGLAVLNLPDVKRPFLETEFFYEPLDKPAVFGYAAKRGLRFREDQTNTDTKFLRNLVREKLHDMGLTYEDKLKLWQLVKNQQRLGREIDESVTSCLPNDGIFQRKWFTELDDNLAIEILRAATLAVGISATRPQLRNFLTAIRTYNSGKQFNLPNDFLVKFSKTDFTLKSQ